MNPPNRARAQDVQPKTEPSDDMSEHDSVSSDSSTRDPTPARSTRQTGRAQRKPKKPSKKKDKKPRAATMPFIDRQDGELEHIAVVEADSALAKFPDLLKQQLKDYFAKPDTSAAVFGTNANTYSIHKATDTGKPMYFFEPDTDIRLDAALYRYGIGKKSVQMTVVQGRAGSNFNKGDPSIIVYFGKKTAGKGRARENGSRWALWTPDGLRRDLMVDRLRVNNDDDEDKTGGSKNADTNADTVLSADYNADADTDTFDTSTAIQQEVPRRNPLKRARSVSSDMALRFVRRRSSIPPVLTAAQSNLNYIFTMDNEENQLLAKSYMQCNSIGKIFAYAQAAGICNSSVFILSVSIEGEKAMDVVRDDKEDFDGLQLLIEGHRQLVGEDATINVVVTPCLD